MVIVSAAPLLVLIAILPVPALRAKEAAPVYEPIVTTLAAAPSPILIVFTPVAPVPMLMPFAPSPSPILQ